MHSNTVLEIEEPKSSQAEAGFTEEKPSPLRNLWLVLLAALMLLPVWCVQQPPLLDYPNHLARTFVLTHLHDPSYHFANYFKSVWGPYPYVGMDLLLIAMQQFMPLAVAGKLLLSICILLFPLSLWWFLRNAAPGQQSLALFGCVLSYQSFFIAGFVNFQLGLSLACILMGYWYRYCKEPSRGRWFVALGLAFLLYFTHLIAFGMTAMLLGAHALQDKERRTWEPKRLAPLFVPGAIMFLFLRPGLSSTDVGIGFRPLLEKLQSLYQIPLHGYKFYADVACYALFILAVALALVKNPELRWNRKLVTVWFCLMGIYWLLPASWGINFFIDVRIVPFLCIVLLAVANIGRRARWVAAVALLIFAVRLADVTTGFKQESAELREWDASFAYIPKGARVLPMIETSDDVDEPIDRPYAHYISYAVIERGAFMPYLFAIPGQMPLRMTYTGYAPDNYWDMNYGESVSWQDVADNYDY